MYFFTVPKIIKWWFKDLCWQMPVSSEKKIYLTFDDGPIPEVTEFVLDELNKYRAQATFFCVGENIYKHPHILKKILENGHSVGNHTYNHVKGWQMDNHAYLSNIQKFEEEFKKHLPNGTAAKLFRPPYGRIKKSQINLLKTRYKIVMWSVLTCDYAKNLSPEDCLAHSIRCTKSGSIVVFHDSLKARKNLYYVLPKFLHHFHTLGYQFEAL